MIEETRQLNGRLLVHYIDPARAPVLQEHCVCCRFEETLCVEKGLEGEDQLCVVKQEQEQERVIAERGIE